MVMVMLQKRLWVIIMIVMVLWIVGEYGGHKNDCHPGDFWPWSQIISYDFWPDTNKIALHILSIVVVDIFIKYFEFAHIMTFLIWFAKWSRKISFGKYLKGHYIFFFWIRGCEYWLSFQRKFLQFMISISVKNILFIIFFSADYVLNFER